MEEAEETVTEKLLRTGGEEMPMDDVLRAAAAEVTTSFPDRRVKLFKTLASLLPRFTGSALHRRKLLDVIFQTLPLYGDRPSMKGVDDLVLQSLCDSTFVKPFVDTLLEFMTQERPVGSFKLLRWSTSVLHCSHLDTLFTREEFSNLAKAQAVLSQLLMDGSARRRHTCKKIFKHLLSESKTCKKYINEINKLKILTRDSTAFVNLIVDFTITSSSLSSRHKPTLLHLYVKTVLRATVQPPREAIEAFKPLLSAIGQGDFKEVMLPACTTMLKRTPEIVLKTIGHLLMTVDLDLSSYSMELLPPLLDQALHSDVERRTDSLSIIGTLSHKSSQPDTQLSMFNAIKAILAGEGTEGMLSPEKRVRMLNALEQLSRFPLEKISTSGLAPSICGFILSYKDDGSNDVKLAALAALASWISVSSEALAPEITSFIADGLRATDTLRKEHLTSMRVICKKSDSLTKVAPLLDHLIRLSNTGLSNEIELLDGLYAISKISIIDAEADSSFAKEELWRLIAPNEQPVISLQLLSKLKTDQGCLTLVDLLQSLLVDHGSRVPSLFPITPLLEVLIYLVCHESWEVRRMAYATINAVLKRSPTLAQDLLLLLSKQIHVDSSGDSQQPFIPSTHSLVKCLFLIAPYAADQSGSQYELIFCTHHPCISSSPSGLWKWLQRSLKHQNILLTETISPNISVICKKLLSQDGLFSSNKQEQSAALLSLSTLMTMSPNDTFTTFEKHLEELPDRDLHDAFSEDDIKIFFTSEGQLSKQGVYCELVIQNLLKEEALVREHVGHVQKNLALMLDTLGELAIAHPIFIRDRLTHLAKYVEPLLSSPIVGYTAFYAMFRLARCIDPPLCNWAIDIASAFRVISVEGFEAVLDLMPVTIKEDNKKRPSPGLFEQLVTGLTAACKGGPLPADLITFFFPIIEGILLSSKKTRLHDALLQILSKHLDALLLLRPRMFSVLYHVLSCDPDSHTSVEPMLKELCLGLPGNNLEQALVGLYSEEVHVRIACLTAIEHVPSSHTVPPVLEEVARLAERLSDQLGFDIWTDYTGLLGALSYKNDNVRAAAAQALKAVLSKNPDKIRDMLPALFEMYKGFCGDESCGRRGVALALDSVVDLVASIDIPDIITFLITYALADSDKDVRDIMMNAGTKLIDKYGKDNHDVLFPIFESYKKKRDSDDLVREGVVNLTDALMKHLPKDDSVESIVQNLLDVPASTADPPPVFLPASGLDQPPDRLLMVLSFKRLPDHVVSVAKELFVVTMLKGQLAIGLESEYFVSLGGGGTDIYHAVFERMEYHHARKECLDRFEPKHILYIPSLKVVVFSSEVKVQPWSLEKYKLNILDGAAALGILRYNPEKAGKGDSNIYESDISKGVLPPYLSLLVKKMKNIESRTDVSTNALFPKWRSMFKCDLAGKTIECRLVFLSLFDLHGDHLKSKEDLKIAVGNVRASWKVIAKGVPSLNATINYTFKNSDNKVVTVAYDTQSLLCLWICGRNHVMHADKDIMNEVEAEAIFSSRFHRELSKTPERLLTGYKEPETVNGKEGNKLTVKQILEMH